ncbi:hypothetical protein GN244_ATG06093 [Phytophthora infestans]|uniref:Uncharacterized protein n=1 Tax=Phytophthora infestans TaxID=4787 RepID=A0A833SVV8_PHYIN|nr:hypothetical protein GN244_ATG06093 [Phytophthora infestans]
MQIDVLLLSGFSLPTFRFCVRYCSLIRSWAFIKVGWYRRGVLDIQPTHNYQLLLNSTYSEVPYRCVTASSRMGAHTLCDTINIAGFAWDINIPYR